MNKTAIKNFAIWARNKLIASCEQKALMVGITEDGIADKLAVSTGDTEFYDIGTSNPYSIYGKAIKQRRELVKAINNRTENGDYKSAFHSIMEEVAYTWFNRLIALRFMEVNGYLKDDMRILSSVSEGKLEPDAVTSPFDWELEFSDEERDRIIQLQNNNEVDELFRLLFIKECNALNVSLPYLFEKTEDYSEFLLSISVTDVEGVVYKLVHDIPEEDFNIEMGGQVEIIGWLYQYYNDEAKNIINKRPKSQKVSKKEIPAVTQLFTPDWIVRYMVENSLGRLWLEGHPSEGLKSNWHYYLEEAEQEPEVEIQLEELRQDRKSIQPENIKVIDPCMGSGHILVYAFDVLMDIYRENGYVERDAAQSIIKNNLYGLDIDQRAFQLAYFAVMMKGRQYDRRMLTRNIEPNLCAIEESNGLIDGDGNWMVDKSSEHYGAVVDLLEKFRDAKTYGSIINLGDINLDEVNLYLYEQEVNQDNNLFAMADYSATRVVVEKLLHQAKIMGQKYDVVVTNPPYMGSGKMNPKLSEFVKKYYPNSWSDLCVVFIEKCLESLKDTGYQAMITQQSWMFLSSYKKLRTKLQGKTIINMAHLGPRAFEEIGGEVVQTTSFVMSAIHLKEYKGTYARLIEPTTQQGKEEMFLQGDNRFVAKQENFSKIPGSPVAYWVSESFLSNFEKETIADYYVPKFGMSTGDGEAYIRFWYECSNHDIKFDCTDIEKYLEDNKTWAIIDKGGNYRRWFGNRINVVFWKNNGERIKSNPKSAVRSPQFFFHPHISWTLVSSDIFSARFFDTGFVLDTASNCIYFNDKSNPNYVLALLNSTVASVMLSVLNPTINMSCGVMAGLPYITVNNTGNVEQIVKQNISISKSDWDSFETSWDFKSNPLVTVGKGKSLADSYEAYQEAVNVRFAQLKANEEKLNRIFIDIYGLSDELTPEVADKDLTVASIFDTKDDIPESYKGNNYVLTKENVIKNLISYAVGCLFGRYSLNKPGLIYAGGDWDNISRESFTEADFAKGIPDDDNIIPITDEAYFEDDITGRFVSWIKEAFGADNLEDNLAFIANALRVKGENSRDVIRNYFLSGFYADHVKKYQKRPIYWLYDSGKNNGFKALIYMHRYDADTTGRVRMDYLHRMEQIYGDEINRVTTDIQESTEAREKAKLQKRLAKLEKQVKECREYDEKIGHLALEHITIDLDDGVNVNYEKVQTDRSGNKYNILG